MKSFLSLLFFIPALVCAQIFDNQETSDSAKIDRIKKIEDYLFEFSSGQDLINKISAQMQEKVKEQDLKIKTMEATILKHQSELMVLKTQIEDLAKLLAPKKDDPKGAKSKLISRDEFEELQKSYNDLKSNTENNFKSHEAGLKAVQTILIQMEKEKNRLKN